MTHFASGLILEAQRPIKACGNEQGRQVRKAAGADLFLHALKTMFYRAV